MSDEQKAPDVRALEDRYQILGELRSDAGPRTYIGKRKADGADVLIRVVRSAKNDNNALAHFASDAQLLSDLDHPIVLRTLESRWLSADTIAVVNERVRGRTLDEMLASARGAHPRGRPDGARLGARTRHRTPRRDAREPLLRRRKRSAARAVVADVDSDREHSGCV